MCARGTTLPFVPFAELCVHAHASVGVKDYSQVDMLGFAVQKSDNFGAGRNGPAACGGVQYALAERLGHSSLSPNSAFTNTL